MSVKGPLREAYSIQIKKAADYQGSTLKRSQYFPFGKLSYVQMIWIKTLRLRSLVMSGGTPMNESIRDTLLDLINYSAFFIEHLDKEELK